MNVFIAHWIGASYSLSWVHWYKKAQRVLWKIKQNHLYWIAMWTSHYTPSLFRMRFKQGKNIFFCESPFAAFPGGRRTYEGWHEGKPSFWIKNVVFGVYFPFDIIERIPAWSRKMAIMKINYYPRAYRTEEVFFLNCLLNWMLITNHGLHCASNEPLKCEHDCRIQCEWRSAFIAIQAQWV